MNHSHLFVVPDPPARHLTVVEQPPALYTLTPFGLMTDDEITVACTCGGTGVCLACVLRDLDGTAA